MSLTSKFFKLVIEKKKCQHVSEKLAYLSVKKQFSFLLTLLRSNIFGIFPIEIRPPRRGNDEIKI